MERAVSSHNAKLNNYLKYGIAVETPPAEFKPLEVEKHVRHMNTESGVHNMNYCLVTILCCEDDGAAY